MKDRKRFFSKETPPEHMQRLNRELEGIPKYRWIKRMRKKHIIKFVGNIYQSTKK